MVCTQLAYTALGRMGSGDCRGACSSTPGCKVWQYAPRDWPHAALPDGFEPGACYIHGAVFMHEVFMRKVCPVLCTVSCACLQCVCVLTVRGSCACLAHCQLVHDVNVCRCMTKMFVCAYVAAVAATHVLFSLRRHTWRCPRMQQACHAQQPAWRDADHCAPCH